MDRQIRKKSRTGIYHVMLGMKNDGTFGVIDGLMLRGDTTLLWRFDGGYVDLNANGTPTRWNYYITDHLGSTRMVVDSNDSIRERRHLASLPLHRQGAGQAE